MVGKSKAQAMETRSQLLDSAEAVFFDKGYAHTRLMDIANHAGMTRGAIYWHFKNKVDLFEAMVDRVRLPIDEIAEAHSDDKEDDPLGKMQQFSTEFLQQLANDNRRRRVFTILFHRFELNGEAQDLEARQKIAFGACTDRIERALKNAVNKGQLPAKLDTHKAAIAKHAYFTGIIYNWLFMPEQFDLTEMAQILVNNFYFMLQNSPHLLVGD
ncbi:TetR family transcriptional regulator [Catenovulum sediminis]|uniref:TetR family transcriptional regulator n=1 Tax=Catenovulum sediminis TaxID=1740262 RepID=A0ABV1RNK6_9ALTE